MEFGGGGKGVWAHHQMTWCHSQTHWLGLMCFFFKNKQTCSDIWCTLDGWKGLTFIGKSNGILTNATRKHSDALSIVEYLSLPKEDLLAYEFRTGEVFRPSYFIARDRATNSIVLSIRGTMVSHFCSDILYIVCCWRYIKICLPRFVSAPIRVPLIPWQILFVNTSNGKVA